MSKNKIIILLTALTLGTTWAIRGQFGHEQGAAWAGGIACLLLIFSIGNPKWMIVGVKASLMGAIGWGMGGMMSYGVVVGYGRSEDWLNATYGLLMLGVIGGLYGLLGGGLFGLGLEEGSSGKKIAWPQLVVEMTAGALIFYFFIIEQLGILMTPPRSEAWGVCAGAGIAMLYYMVRNHHAGALRTALFSAIGGGLGFAFGDFLQVMGFLSKIHFNFWNVMEYSLGFFGGLGMAYGTLTGFKNSGKTEASEQNQFNPRLKWSLIGLVGIIPLIVFHQSFVERDLLPTFENFGLSNPSYWASFTLILAFIIWVLMQMISFGSYKKLNKGLIGDGPFLKQIGLTLFLAYMCYSILITGAFISIGRIEQYLYLLNFIVIVYLMSRLKNKPEDSPLSMYSPSKVGLIAFLVILVVATIAAFSHGPIPGAQMRF
ncbi:hypothetical protein [Algoriphagus sp. PAP.12]|uniref:hypothetical protein n=1 Tax=Algoriphagus sp. PAP.12 TaxID=2996678 RepID=UPI00227D24BC|nr:hypothetical protein [Algoriphagus sp. PAP.12]